MSNRKVYHITPNPQGGWRVGLEKAARASSLKDTKDEAVNRAKELAKSNPLSQVVIHGQNGRIQTEYTYGNDPHPPDG